MKNIKVILFALMTIFTLAACDQASVDEWMTTTESLRVSAVSASKQLPYRRAQYEDFRDYFRKISQMSLQIKQEPKVARKVSKEIEKLDVGSFCERVLISSSEWRRIIQNCTRHRYFLCSEEVRSYPEIVKAFSSSLDSQARTRFQAARACQI